MTARKQCVLLFKRGLMAEEGDDKGEKRKLPSTDMVTRVCEYIKHED